MLKFSIRFNAAVCFCRRFVPMVQERGGVVVEGVEEEG
jgi:hypothetical protein